MSRQETGKCRETLPVDPYHTAHSRSIKWFDYINEIKERINIRSLVLSVITQHKMEQKE